MSTKRMELLIHGYRLELTCAACPEQYDVFDTQGNQVGYLRLRHGVFTATVPDVVGGECVYRANVLGDGRFNNSERHGYLTLAIEHIQAHIANYTVDSIADYWYNNCSFSD